MKYGVILLLLVLSTACGRKGDVPDGSSYHVYELPEDLKSLGALYASLVPEVQDQYGFIETDKCDSLLFSSLLGVTGATLRVHAAEDPGIPGRWYRRPVSYDPCFIAPDTPNGSSSTISRDMLLGLMWYAWSQEDLSTLQDLYTYGEANNWKMGDGLPTRTGLRTLRSTLAVAIERLGGKPAGLVEELVVDPNIYTNENYAGHLQALHILLRGELYGELSSHSIGVLEELADINTDIPFFQAAAARWSGNIHYAQRFVETARNTKWFPSDGLPTSSDRCVSWFQDQLNPADLSPCSGGRTHSGGDLLFAMYVYQGMRPIK